MSALDYPPPAYAGYIWARGDALVLSFATEGGGGHTVVLPFEKLVVGNEADQRGWLILLEVLRERARAVREERRPALGTAEMPTSYQVEQLLAGKRAKAFTVRGQAVLDDIFDDDNGGEEAK